jgi:hypothetical protein
MLSRHNHRMLVAELNRKTVIDTGDDFYIYEGRVKRSGHRNSYLVQLDSATEKFVCTCDKFVHPTCKHTRAVKQRFGSSAGQRAKEGR